MKDVSIVLYSLTLQLGTDGYMDISEALNVVKRWHSYIADLRAEHKSVVLLRDNASEYRSEKIMQFLDSKGV